MYTVDENGKRVNVRTVGEAVTNAQGETLENVEAGAQVNKIETIQIAGQTVSIVNKTANLDVYTRAEVDAKITSTYKAAGSAANVAALGTLDAAHEGFVYNMTAQFTTTTDFVEGAGKKHPAGTNVVIVNAGTADAPSYKYDVMAGFIDTSDYDNHIANTDIHVTAAQKTEWSGKQDAIADLADIRTGAAAGATAVQPAALTTALEVKQDKIDASNKLNGDYISGNILRYVETLD